MDVTTIGKINNTHGLNGEVSIQVEAMASQYLKKESFIFIEIKNQSFIPYRILNIKKENQQYYIMLLKGFSNIEEAKQLVGKSIALESNKFDKKETLLQSNYLSSYTIVDQQLGLIGAINQIAETAGQMLAFVNYKDVEVIIPMNADMIIDIDEDKQSILMDIPDGLLDIYLNQ